MSGFLNVNQQLSDTVKIIFIIIAGLVLPVILIPLVKFTNYSEVIEEISKALVVLFLILKISPQNIEGTMDYKLQIFAGISFGFLFGLSESILYFNNIFQLGVFNIFIQRAVGAIPMHIITALIILLFTLKNKKLIIAGLVITIIIHIFFNSFVAL